MKAMFIEISKKDRVNYSSYASGENNEVRNNTFNTRMEHLY